MSLTTSEMTPADIAAVTNNGGGNGWGGFGGDALIALIVLFLFGSMGWGGMGFGGMGMMGGMGMWPWLLGFGNGFGGNNAGLQGALTREQACIDNNFNNLARTAEATNSAVNQNYANLNSTICHQQYDTARMINGLENTMQSGFNSTNIAMLQGQNAANITALQNANALQAQLAQCCCDQRTATENVRFTIAQEDCNTRNLIQSSTRDLIDNNNVNTRAILDKLTQQELAAKDAQIAAQTQKIFGLELAASQAAQNNYLISRLNPTPVPAYPAASPCGLGNWAPSVLANGYGFNNGCACAC